MGYILAKSNLLEGYDYRHLINEGGMWRGVQGPHYIGIGDLGKKKKPKWLRKLLKSPILSKALALIPVVGPVLATVASTAQVLAKKAEKLKAKMKLAKSIAERDKIQDEIDATEEAVDVRVDDVESKVEEVGKTEEIIKTVEVKKASLIPGVSNIILIGGAGVMAMGFFTLLLITMRRK